MGNYSLEPICDRHHDIERAKEEDKMEVGIAVDGALFLIINYILSSSSLLLLAVICNKSTDQLALNNMCSLMHDHQMAPLSFLARFLNGSDF